MTVATLAAALIRVFEGCRLEAYQDSGGVWTIGFGHTAGVKQGDRCDMLAAILWYEQDSAPIVQLLTGLVEPDLELYAKAAYASFAYNAGRLSEITASVARQAFDLELAARLWSQIESRSRPAKIVEIRDYEPKHDRKRRPWDVILEQKFSDMRERIAKQKLRSRAV